MNVLITGGTGFVGLNLAEALLARGDRVALFGLDPPPPNAKAVFEKLPGKVGRDLGRRARRCRARPHLPLRPISTG